MNQTNIQERIAYINARKDLLQFFFEHMYSNNTEEDKELVLSIFPFNTKVNPFLNDLERMKYFIDRFNQYYNEETYDFIVCHPADADEQYESHDPDAVDSSYILRY